MEECGELIQECSKAIRYDKYYDNDRLKEEIGDVQCMLDLIQEFDLVSHDEINDRAALKEEKLKKWSELLD